MRPTLLHGTAPSPLVLSFLRAQVSNAFEAPIAQCAALRRQRYGASTRIAQAEGAKARRGAPYISLRNDGPECTSSTARKCLLESRSLSPAPDHTLTSRHTPQSSLRSSTFPHRSFSTTPSNNAWNIFKSAHRRRLDQLQAPPPPPDENSAGSMGFGSSLGRIMRPANELKMRCTELDEHGNVTLVSGEFKKSELIAKVCFEPYFYISTANR